MVLFLSGVALASFLAILMTPSARAADQQTVLYEFKARHDGAFPAAGLIKDAAGNLFGTTSDGLHTYGTVYELSPDGNGGYRFKVIYTLQNKLDGAIPQSQLVFDANGNLYGTSVTGGSSSQGAVFELSQDRHGHWYLSSSYDFMGTYDGGHPAAGVIVDASGNVYGTTEESADNSNAGTVFELKPSQRFGFVEKTLHAFTGASDGGFPHGALIQDGNGDLYGVTPYGGAKNSQNGLVFKLHHAGKQWRETVLYNFTGNDDGANPQTNPIFDAAGNLFGTTTSVGGNAYELSPPAPGEKPRTPWHLTVLHQFIDNAGGLYPYGGLVFDTAGNLYGATSAGGSPSCQNGCGVTYKLSASDNGSWPETVLLRFNGHRDGAEPNSPLLPGPNNTFYGTTNSGGKGAGVIYSLQK